MKITDCGPFCLYKKWKKRGGELFARFDEGVETVLVAGIIWQTWRMWLLTYSAETMTEHTGLLNQAAMRLTRDSVTFWNGAFNMPLLVAFLLFISVLSFIGLMEKNEYMRISGTLFACGWWFVSGTLLTIHSPLHDAGGLYYILGVSGILIYAHRFVMLDRQVTIRFINNLIYKYNIVVNAMHIRHLNGI